MRCAFRLAVLAAAFGLLPLSAAPPENGPLDEAQLRARLVAGQYVEGRVSDSKLTGDNRTVTVDYVYQYKRKVDPIAGKKVEFWKKLHEKAVESKFEPFIEKTQEELYKAQKEAAEIVDVAVPFVVKIDDNVKVRTLVVPLDDNGKPKKLTPEEQKELKGDTRYPGYTAQLSDLSTGTPVRFSIDRIKYRPPSSKQAKSKDGEEPKLVYPITMIVIAPAPMGSLPAGENPFFKK